MMDILFVCGAGLIAGFINAVAGGGTLISFPALLAAGFSAVGANVTSTLSLFPGYLGGMYAQRREIPRQTGRLILLIPVSIIGGLAGGLILIRSDEQVFQALIPFLILGASLLLLVQGLVKSRMASRGMSNRPGRVRRGGGVILIFFSSVYGGYFGAGVSVIVLAVLGMVYDDSLAALTVVKQAISLSVNLAAALFFAVTWAVNWPVVLAMCTCSLLGGYAGGSVVERINPDHLRWVVAGFGILLSLGYLLS